MRRARTIFPILVAVALSGCVGDPAPDVGAPRPVLPPAPANFGKPIAIPRARGRRCPRLFRQGARRARLGEPPARQRRRLLPRRRAEPRRRSREGEPVITHPNPDMRRALGKKMREAFAPVTGAGTAADAEIAALCARIGRVGGDRPARPFPDRDREH